MIDYDRLAKPINSAVIFTHLVLSVDIYFFRLASICKTAFWLLSCVIRNGLMLSIVIKIFCLLVLQEDAGVAPLDSFAEHSLESSFLCTIALCCIMSCGIQALLVQINQHGTGPIKYSRIGIRASLLNSKIHKLAFIELE